MKRFHFSQIVSALAIILLSGCATLSGRLFEPDVNAARYDDAGIKTSIGSALLKRDASKANDINIHSFNGHVFLVGEADQDFRAIALATAQETEGVVHVTTHWFPTGTASTLGDAAIEAQIDLKRLFARKEENHRAAVDFDVWGGNVVLTGLADNQSEIDRALVKIKSITHVKSVTSYITVAEL